MALKAPAYLARSRHGIFYFRITIPTALSPLFTGRELKRSLQTTHRPTATRLARACASRCEALFQALQEKPVTYREMRALLEASRDAMLASLKDSLNEHGPWPYQKRRETARQVGALRQAIREDAYTPYAREVGDQLLQEAQLAAPLPAEKADQFYRETDLPPRLLPRLS